MPSVSSRDRFYAAVNHQTTDRVPVDLFWSGGEVLDQLRKHLGLADDVDMRKVVGSDMAWIGGRKTRYPGYEKKLAVSREKFPALDPNKVWHDENTFEDAWGTVERFGSDRHYLQWITGPLAKIDTVEELQSNWSVPHHEYVQSAEDYAKYVAEWKAKDYVVIAGVSLPFKVCWYLRGMEKFMMDMVSNVEYAEYLFDKIYAHNTAIAVDLAKAGVDVISVVGDIGGQDSLMFSPRVFRKLMKPRYAAFVQAVKAANPKTLIFNHSDGNVMSVVGDYIDIGVDILNPIQPECMDIPALKKQYGNNITFHGAVSVQTTIPQGSVEDVRAEVKSRIEVLGKSGGYILAPTNVIPYNSPVQNVAEVFRAAGSMTR
ncbi:MAG: uroporphyrinogen decarboxylase family protein [Planctomycetota bacterium]